MNRIAIINIGFYLLVSIQEDLCDQSVLSLQDDLSQEVVKSQAKGVLIDISTLEVVDSFVGRVLNNMALVTNVLGAHAVIVGMRPAVAITIVELGLSLNGIRTALNVIQGMALLRRLGNPSFYEGGYELDAT